MENKDEGGGGGIPGRPGRKTTAPAGRKLSDPAFWTGRGEQGVSLESVGRNPGEGVVGSSNEPGQGEESP